jgi:hypothetical protein
MNNNGNIQLMTSTSLDDINIKRLRGWCIHLICIGGNGKFLYNGKLFQLKKNAVAVISHPELITAFYNKSEIKIKYIATTLQFLNSLLPNNNYSIGGGICLFENPIIQLTETDAAILLHDMDNIIKREYEQDNIFHKEVIGGLFITMMYDLFNFHAKLNSKGVSTELCHRL